MEQKSSQLFNNRVLERLTRVNHNTPFFVYIPITLLCIYWGLTYTGLKSFYVPIYFAIGLFTWTFFEYILHRFIFHYEPKTNFGKRLHYLFHGIHHDFPQEVDRLVMPPAASIMIALPVFGLFYLAFEMTGVVMFAGFLLGYLYYEFIHYSVHHKKKTNLLWNKAQQKNHLQHHFKNYDRQFGVTSSLWDYIFRTH